ncbi:MAG: hypothetical protein ABSF29_15575 [Tepidisphaeraceae bacterium]|jgi:hypothetical protein
MSLRKYSPFLAAPAAAAALFLMVTLILAGPSWLQALYRFSNDLGMAAVWLIACAGLGWIVYRFVDAGGELAFVTCAAAGMGILSLLILIFGLLGWLNEFTAYALPSVGLAIALVRAPKIKWKPPENPGSIWALVSLAPLAALVFVAALFPPGLLWGDEPNGYDVAEYHLQVPREWFEAAKIFPLHHNVFSYFPFNVEMHYLLAMHLLGGPWAGMYLAQLMHATMCGLMVAAVWSICGGGWRGTVAAVFTAAVPWTPLLAAVAYNEGGMLLWGTLAIGWAMRAKNSRQFALAGFFAGLAAGAKLTAVPVLWFGIPAAMLITHPSTRTLRQIGCFIVCAALSLSPWLIRNQIWSGNPVFPEAMKLLGQGHFSDVQVQRWHLAHELPDAAHRSASGRLAALAEQVVTDARYGYILLPLALTAILLSRQRQTVFLAILLGAQLLFWLCFTHVQGRFMVLAIPIAAILIAQVDGRAWKTTASLAAVMMLGLGTTLIALRLSRYLDVDRNQVTLIGRENLNGMRMLDVTQLPKDAQVDLVGDACAFFYQIPMSRLHYKTVFDVDTSDPSKTIIDDWLAGMPPTKYVDIDAAELNRLAKTYYNLPPLSSSSEPSN